MIQLLGEIVKDKAMYDTFTDVYSLGFSYSWYTPTPQEIKIKKQKQYKKAYKRRKKESVGSLFGQLFAIGAVGVQAGANMAVSHLQKNPPKDKNSLHINVQNGNWISTTVKKFTIKLKGDSLTGYREREDSSGNSLFQSGYADFYYLPVGNYVIYVNGINTNGKEIFSLSGSVYVSGEQYCTIDVKKKSIYCK